MKQRRSETTQPKILLFFEYGTLNGGEFSLLAVLEALGSETFEFVAAVPSTGRLTTRLGHLGIRTVPLRLRTPQGKKLSIAQVSSHLESLIKRISPDLVHANSLSMGRMLGRVAPQLSIPCTAHLRDIIRLSKAAVADLNQNTGLVAVSQATRAFHLEQGLQPHKLQVIHNGVDTSVFRPRRPTGTLRQDLGLSDRAILIANIGQICLRKGQTLLAQAAVSLAEAFPKAYYLFVGKRYSQKQESVAYEDEIKGVFRKGGIEHRLFSLGFRDDIPGLLNQIDLLVHTAHQEPLGRVLLEAAACGRAMVATEVGGTTEILTDRESALLVPPNNVDALAGAMRELLQDCALRHRLGRQARQQVIENFPLRTAAKRMRAFWESFL